MSSEIVCELRNRKDNPRNSEGAFATLADGRLLFAYTRYYGRSWADEATADITARYSEDNGRTWSMNDRILVKNEGAFNVMSVSLLRLQDGRLAMFYLRKNGSMDCRPWMRVSEDETNTWTEPVLCVPAPGYFVVNNDRVVQLRNGRLIMPTAYHRVRMPPSAADPHGKHTGRGMFIMFVSDDNGQTWRETPDTYGLPVSDVNGLQEPGVVELKRGRLYSWCRTGTGRQWELVSRDNGEHWTPPAPSRFLAPCSPMSIKRIPATGDLLAVWNDHRQRWNLPEPVTTGGWNANSSWGRTPLVCALSSDEGKHWRNAKLIETDPNRGFCYTAVHFVDDHVLLAYCCGGRSSGVLQDCCIRRISLDWLYA